MSKTIKMITMRAINLNPQMTNRTQNSINFSYFAVCSSNSNSARELFYCCCTRLFVLHKFEKLNQKINYSLFLLVLLCIAIINFLQIFFFVALYLTHNFLVDMAYSRNEAVQTHGNEWFNYKFAISMHMNWINMRTIETMDAVEIM